MADRMWYAQIASSRRGGHRVFALVTGTLPAMTSDTSETGRQRRHDGRQPFARAAEDQVRVEGQGPWPLNTVVSFRPYRQSVLDEAGAIDGLGEPVGASTP